MPYILIAIVVVFAFVVLAGCQREPTSSDSGSTPTDSAKPMSPGPGSKADIERRLRELARAPAPAELSPGAMCYEMAMPPERAEYVCVVCGEKTLYPTGDEDEEPFGVLAALEWELATCRRLLSKIQHLDVALDETEFCHACSPTATEPQLALVITYHDGTTHRTAGVRTDDLLLLVDLSSGSDVHHGEQDGETPLKQHLPRLEQLLGVSLAGER